MTFEDSPRAKLWLGLWLMDPPADLCMKPVHPMRWLTLGLYIPDDSHAGDPQQDDTHQWLTLRDNWPRISQCRSCLSPILSFVCLFYFLFFFLFHYSTSLPCSSAGKESAYSATQVWFLGWKGPLEKELASNSSILAWRIPWTDEPDRL